MADKKIEISIQDTSGSLPGKDDYVDAQWAKWKAEDKQADKLTAFWKKQEEQDKRDLENLFIESNKKLWERQDREEKQRGDTAAVESFIEMETEARKGLADLIASFNDIDIPSQLDLLGDGSSLATLDEDIEAATQELLALVDGTQEASTWLGRFASSLSSSAAAAVAALGGGGGMGGHGGKAGIFGAFGGGSSGISVGHSLTSAALTAGGSLAILTGATLAFVKVVDKLVEMTGGFSGNVAAAEARAEMQKLQDQLQMAREQGPMIAALQDQSTGIASEGRAIARELLEAFGPWLEEGGEFLRRGFEMARVAAELNSQIFSWFRDRWNEAWGILENLPIIGAAIKKLEEIYSRPQAGNGRTLLDDVNAMFGENQLGIEEENRRRGNKPLPDIDPNFM